MSDNTEGNVSEITPMAGRRKPLRHQATEVAADDQATKSRVAGVATGMKSPRHLGDRPHHRTSIKIGGMVGDGGCSCRNVIGYDLHGRLSNLARTDVPNRAELIKRNVDLYLKDEIGGRQPGLERLRLTIHNDRKVVLRSSSAAYNTAMRPSTPCATL